MVLFPEGLKAWQHLFAGLALIGIIYGAAVALTQNDFKFIIGYSSVSHMGFVLLGLMSLTAIGLTGAVVQMFSHGIIAGLLFAVVGRMVYDRAHTRELSVLQGIGLGKAIPFAGITFLLAALASMGFPGFSGFIAELSILLGAWRTLPVYAVASGIGILIGVGFMLRALHRTFYSDPPLESGGHAVLVPITWAEKTGAGLLLISTVIIGLYPRLIFDLVGPAFQQPLFHAIASTN
jgi:NADH-quinone oxidoreductase subunit M